MGNERIKDICKSCKKCKLNPNNHWENFPNDCLLSDRIFIRREADMSAVRKTKEEILNLRTEDNKNQNNNNSDKIKRLENFVNQLKNHGSADW